MKIYFLFFALGLFLVLRLTSRLLNTMSAKQSVRRMMLRIYPLFEFLVWLGFGLWGLNLLLSDYTFYSTLVVALVIILVVIVGWYFLRDFVAGVILKTEVPFEINQQIKTATHKGTLQKAGYRSVELIDNKGEVIKIPFSQLSSSSFSVVDVNSQQGHEVLLKVKSDISFDTLSSSIKQSLLLLPWVSVNREPCIKEIEHIDNSSLIAVFFHTVGDQSPSKVEHYLRSKFER